MLDDSKVAIYGMLICQDGMPDIVRCIESVYPAVDEYVVMDGGSTDGTWEWLNAYKDVYHLTLFQHPYDEQGAQRNRLLSYIPKHTWVINIDQDEALNHTMTHSLRDYLYSVSPSIYFAADRDLPLTCEVKNFNLAHDILHIQDQIYTFSTKVFYNDRNIHFTPGYHMSICYFDTEGNTNIIKAPSTWAILHYAALNPARYEAYKDPNRSYLKDEWDVTKWTIKSLPEEHL